MGKMGRGRRALWNDAELDGVETFFAGEHVADDDEVVAGFGEAFVEEGVDRGADGAVWVGVEGQVVRIGAPIDAELPADFESWREGVDGRIRTEVGDVVSHRAPARKDD